MQPIGDDVEEMEVGEIDAGSESIEDRFQKGNRGLITAQDEDVWLNHLILNRSASPEQ